MQVIFALPINETAPKSEMVSQPIPLLALTLEEAKQEVRSVPAYAEYSFFQILGDDGLVLDNSVPDHRLQQPRI